MDYYTVKYFPKLKASYKYYFSLDEVISSLSGILTKADVMDSLENGKSIYGYTIYKSNDFELSKHGVISVVSDQIKQIAKMKKRDTAESKDAVSRLKKELKEYLFYTRWFLDPSKKIIALAPILDKSTNIAYPNLVVCSKHLGISYSRASRFKSSGIRFQAIDL